MAENVCPLKSSVEECELFLLRQAVDKASDDVKRKMTNDPSVRKMIQIVENFLRQKDLVCYGGTAINALLRKDRQFYNYDVDIPDYDFFSPDAMNDCIALADIFATKGYENIEAKSGVHKGTYKVFVNFIPIADVTNLNTQLFLNLQRDAVVRDGIKYCPANFLRMSMYLELSRPQGDLSRWEKVAKRLMLLNTEYPLISENCANEVLQRKGDVNRGHEEAMAKVFHLLRDLFVKEGCVFFGSYAISLYSQYMPKERRYKVREIPDFDVLAQNPAELAEKVRQVVSAFFASSSSSSSSSFVNIVHRGGVDDLLTTHFALEWNIVGGDKIIIATIYETMACHSYNELKLQKNSTIRIASIDTILSFYLLFIYLDKDYYDANRLICIAQFLFELQIQNKLKQKGLLRRFTTTCFGEQLQLTDIRKEKLALYQKLAAEKDSLEYRQHFLKYNPLDKSSPVVQRGKRTKRKVHRGKKRTKTKKSYIGKNKKKNGR